MAKARIVPEDIERTIEFTLTPDEAIEVLRDVRGGDLSEPVQEVVSELSLIVEDGLL